MDKEMIYNAIVKVDDDLIDRSLTRKPIKKTKATIILSGSCIAIATCFVLVAVISGVILANRNHSLSGFNELISKNLDASDQIVISMDWPYYKTAEETIEASSHIYSGKVIDISFTVLDMKTGAEDLDPESESASRMLYTVYTISVTDEYKGESAETVRIVVNGGLPGEKENEQFNIIRGSGLKYNGIPVTPEKVELSVGQSYLFCIYRVGDFDHIINPNQFAFLLNSKDAKTIIDCCK